MISCILYTQVFAIEDIFNHRVTNVVFMGMGEPMLNMKSVLEAHQCLNKVDSSRLIYPNILWGNFLCTIWSFPLCYSSVLYFLFTRFRYIHCKRGPGEQNSSFTSKTIALKEWNTQGKAPQRIQHYKKTLKLVKLKYNYEKPYERALRGGKNNSCRDLAQKYIHQAPHKKFFYFF